jgi:putative flippase GtrA
MTSTVDRPDIVTTAPAPVQVPIVDVVVPVYNEAATIVASIERLHRYLSTEFPLTWSITIADNASTDDTAAIAAALAQRITGVRSLHLDGKGRGRALRAAWATSPSPVVAYMDVDLSTDLDALLPLVAPLVSGHSDLAIGSRLARGANVVRGPKRELISRSYNTLLHLVLRTGFSDAQCGFKAMRSDAARRLLPLVEDDGWFFDTELLVLAEHNGLRIHEVPVDWVDDPDSRVDIVGTAVGDLRGMWRVLRRLGHGSSGMVDASGTTPTSATEVGMVEQLARFSSIGLISTVAYAVLYLLIVGTIGPILANLVALALCGVANAAANRRLTFALRGRAGRTRHYLASLMFGLVPVALTSLALMLMGASHFTSTGSQLAVLTLICATCGVFRFVAMRQWVFSRATA